MKEVICVVCPKGCRVQVDENTLEVLGGNGCLRGVKYAKDELTNPKRMITSTVKINSKTMKRIPVITSVEVPKGMMFEVMEAINSVEVSAPIMCHDVIIKNVLGLEADIIATRSVKE